MEMGKCWTFARVAPKALAGLREVYKAEENKAVRVRLCLSDLTAAATAAAAAAAAASAAGATR